MKKILIILLLLISSLSYSQINKLKIGKSSLTDSSGFLKIKSDSTIEMLNYVKFDKKILGDVDITGQYMINGVPLSSGGGDAYLGNLQTFLRKNIFDTLSIGVNVSDLRFLKGDTTWIKTTDNFPLFLGSNNDTAIQIKDDNEVRMYKDLLVDGQIDVTNLNITGTTNLMDLNVIGNYNLGSGYSVGDLVFLKGSNTYLGTVDDNNLIFQRNNVDLLTLREGEIKVSCDLVVDGAVSSVVGFVGDGSQLSGIDAGSINTGTLDQSILPSNVAFKDVSNTFTSQRNTFKSINLVSGADDTIGTGDNFALYFKVNNSPKIKIANNGILSLYSNTLNYTAGSAVVTGTTDDYAYQIKTSDTNRVAISNRGVFSINSKNLVLGGNFTTSGSSALTFTTSGTTSLTLPTSGTLMTGSNLVTGSTDNAILRADGTGGVTTQSSGVTIDDSSNIVLPTITVNLKQGIIYKGSSRFLHTYYAGSSNGNNLFLGALAGNFTMSGTNSSEASLNTGIGGQSLSALTTGYQNTCLGYQSGLGITSGSNNFAMGYGSLIRVTTATNNVAIGSLAGRFTTGGFNVTIGGSSGQGVDGTSTYTFNVGLGFQSLYATETGSGNTAIGYLSLNKNTTGANNIAIGKVSDTNNVTGSSNIIIGVNSQQSANNASSELNIGNVIYGTGMYGTGKIGINTIAPTARLHLPAGTTTAGTAPLKLTSGTNLTTAEAGAFEYNGTNLFFTRTGTTREFVFVGLGTGSAPITTGAIGTIADYYGTSGTRVLTTPVGWFSIVDETGTLRKVPYY